MRMENNGGFSFRSRLVVAAFSAICVVGVAGCGGPASADGDWTGRISFGDEGAGQRADLDLSLSQDENGKVGGSGVLVVESDGERTAKELGSVTGEVTEDGAMALTGTSEEFLSEISVNLEGNIGGDAMEGEATVDVGDLLSNVLSDAGFAQETQSFSGEFSLRKEGE